MQARRGIASAVQLCSAPRGKPTRGAPLSPAHAHPAAGVTAGSETAAAPKVRTQVAYDGPEGSDLLRYELYLAHFLPEITDIGNKTCSVKSGTLLTLCAAGGDSWLQGTDGSCCSSSCREDGAAGSSRAENFPGWQWRRRAMCHRTLLTLGAASCPALHTSQADLSPRRCLRGSDEHYSSHWDGC